MFTGHASAIANDERGMERRNGFLVTTIPKVLGQVVFEDAIAVDGYRSVLGDAREAVNLLRQAFNARGGGKPAMVQGSVSASEIQIRELF